MAKVSSVSPGLSTRRSTQSGDKAMTGGYTAVYTQSSAAPFALLAAYFDLSSMQIGDSIDIRIRLRLSAAGAWIPLDTTNYLNAPPAGHQIATIGNTMNVYGIEISMRQTAGVLRTIPCEFFDAIRLGL